MYADNENDELLFQLNSQGTLDMLETGKGSNIIEILILNLFQHRIQQNLGYTDGSIFAQRQRITRIVHQRTYIGIGPQGNDDDFVIILVTLTHSLNIPQKFEANKNLF